MLISERILHLIKKKNITQAEFAKRAGIASSTVSEWKKKKTNPSADKIMDICIVLEITPEQLLTGKDIDDNYVAHKSIYYSTDLKFSKSDIRIIQDIRGMKDAQRKRVLKYIEALKQIEELENLE